MANRDSASGYIPSNPSSNPESLRPEENTRSTRSQGGAIRQPPSDIYSKRSLLFPHILSFRFSSTPSSILDVSPNILNSRCRT